LGEGKLHVAPRAGTRVELPFVERLSKKSFVARVILTLQGDSIWNQA
jgi:hypothetical protein